MASALDGTDARMHYADDLVREITGLEPEHVENYDLVGVDPDERVQIRIDRNNAPAELVERFAFQMGSSVFPPPVLTLDKKIIDGNTRIKARRAREDRFTHAVIVPITFDDADDNMKSRLHYLGLLLNSVNGKPLDRVEQRSMVRDGLTLGLGPQEISYTAGVPLNVVARIRNEIAAEDKLRRVGLESSAVRDASLRALGKRDIVDLNDVPYRELATLAVDAGFNAGEITALAASVRETGSDELGIERINRERDANAQRIEDRRRGGNGHPPASRQLRQRLGYITKNPSDSFVETNVETMGEHLEQIVAAITVLQEVEAKQRQVIEERAA